MAVGLEIPTMLYPVKGFELGVASAGIKKIGRKDVMVMRCCEGAQVVGVFTRNAFCAAPVIVSKRHLATANAIRYVVTNTGNANAGTGAQGIMAANAVCEALAAITGGPVESILPFSTGVIGEPLPVAKITAVLNQAIADLKEDNWLNAATAIMTTDTTPKGSSIRFEHQGRTITVTGISKGAGMICPNMGTMLGYIATDAKVAKPVLQALLTDAANKSFNRITIDGDTSTNDSCLLIATGNTELTEITETKGDYFDKLKVAVFTVAMELAQAIVRDGEGATKFVTVAVNGGKTHQECLAVAYAIAHSPLVKTALYASDPNWGRILAAIGYAGVEDLAVNNVDIFLDNVQLVAQGGRAKSYTEEQGAHIMQQAEFTIRVELNRGACQETIWTTDLSHEYVKINAEYRT